MSNCLQCGAALPAVSFGDVSDYCADCRKQVAPAPKRRLIDDLPQISTSTHRWLNATNVLFALNCLVFVVMSARGASLFQPETDDLLRWGADYGPYTLGGQYWRAITSSFLHIGILHLGVNMWCLLRLGRMLEKLVSAWIVVGVYLLTGVGAALLSLSWNPIRVSAGASGSIFGIVGVLISLLFYAKLDIPQNRMSKLRGYVTRFALVNLFYGLASHIDNMAHLGGLVTGLVIGFFLARSFGTEPQELFRQVRVLIVAACALLVIFVPVANAKKYAVELDQAQAAIRAQDYKSAIVHLERYNRSQEDASGHALLGYAYQNTRRYPEAASEYQHALKLEPGSPNIEVALGEVYFFEGRAKEAVPLFEHNMSKAGADGKDYLIYGQALAATGDYELAESVLRESISLDGKNVQAHLERAKALRALHRDPEAREEDEKAAALKK